MLDLFAGTGALGIEALSRGATFALFIDEGAEARALLRENVATLGLGGTSKIFRRDATKLGEPKPLAPFSLAFLDPPYGQGLATAALNSARTGGWLTPDALIVVEEADQSAIRRARRLSRTRPATLRRYGVCFSAAGQKLRRPLEFGSAIFGLSSWRRT